jgi:hypothetical protein
VYQPQQPVAQESVSFQETANTKHKPCNCTSDFASAVEAAAGFAFTGKTSSAIGHMNRNLWHLRVID